MAATGVSSRQAYFDQMRNQLMQNLGMTNTNPYSSYRPNVMDPLNGSRHYTPPGAINIPYGTTPSDHEVQKFIEMNGGYPDQRSPQTPPSGYGRSTGTRSMGAQPTAPDAYQSMLTSLAGDFQSKIDEANAANIARYNEAKQGATDLRTRNQGRVQNWGTAASADVQERMKEELGNISANLAARGLGNSTILPAFQERNARDTARELQRISEMRDSRASQYDTQDTNNLLGIIERRNDVAPDYSQLVGIADRVGQAQALQSFNDQMAQRAQMQNQQQGYSPLDSYPGIPNYGAPAGSIRGIGMMNLFGNAMNSYLPYSQPGPAYYSQGQESGRSDKYKAGLEMLKERKSYEAGNLYHRTQKRKWTYERPAFNGTSPARAYEIAKKQWASATDQESKNKYWDAMQRAAAAADGAQYQLM